MVFLLLMLAIKIFKCTSFNYPFVKKLLKYRIMFKDILTIFVFNYRDTLIITLYLVVLRNRYTKIR